MRHITRLLLIGVVAFSCDAVAVFAQKGRQMGGAGLTAWADVSHRGSNHTFLDDTPDLRSVGMDNLISSLRVASGEIWQVCDGYNYTGRCQVFSAEESDLRRRDWNDLISSVRRLRGGGQGPLPPGPGPRGLELYAGTQYSGQRVMLEQATPDLRRLNFSDRAMSVRVPRGEVWELCVNLNYDDCRVIDSDVPNLDEIQLSRLITSARLRPGRSGGGGGLLGRLGRSRLILYERPGYAGRAFTIDESEPLLKVLNDLNGSARVTGRWELCDAPKYGGECVTITSDVRDLRTLNLRDRIASVRPR